MDKRGIELEELGWILLGLVILIILVIGIIILKGKGYEYIQYIKQLFRFK